MSREWPPGWEDPEDAELDAEELDEETDVRLAEVSAFLATVSAPVLPGAIESRIMAALAAESAARGEDSPARAPEPDGPRILRPAPARARVRRGVYRVRRFDRIRPAMVAGPLVACLLFAGLGYAISLGGASSSSSVASSAPSAAAPASSAAASSSGSASSGFGSAAGGTAKTPHFGIEQSGNRYMAATLVTQVRSELAALHSAPTAITAPSAAASSAAASSAPAASSSSTSSQPLSTGAAAVPAALQGCVLHLTGNVKPQLIDLATYQGKPAYVIATASRVWVVGLGCTAQHLELIASASLAG